MATVQVTQLHLVSIYVSDLYQARDFYVEHFGFEDAGEMPPGLLLKGGGAVLYLEEGRQSFDHAELDPLPAEICPCFGIVSVKAGAEALAAAGLPLVMPYTEFSPGFAMFAVVDPDGNRLEFAGQP